jgi:hypothetical protein
MAFRGASFLAIWNDIEGIAPTEYDAWLTHEHMIERVGIPGFLRGRRYIAHDDGPHRYFNCYETRDAAVMTSAAYLERLNHPTPLTRRVMPCLTNFQRMGCRTVGTAGQQVGGALATLRFRAPVGAVERAGPALCDALVQSTVVTACHLGTPEAAVAAVSTRERELRPATANEGTDDHVLLVESANGVALREHLPHIVTALHAHVAEASDVQSRVYGLSYLIEPTAD